MDFKQWEGFVGGDWKTHINVRDFINKNYTAYTGDDSFLVGATDRTKAVLAKLEEYKAEKAK